MDLVFPAPLQCPTRESEQAVTVLIVDDEARFRDAYRSLLAGPGRQVEECSNGQAAMTRMARRDIDVVVLDLGLPDVDGVEIMAWLVRELIQTSVIVFSANSSIDAAIHALRRGAFEFIRKPAPPDTLIEAVERALKHRRLLREHAQMTNRLEQSERLHRFLVEQSPDLIYAVDPDGRFSYINGRIEPLLGYQPQELIGQHYSTILHEEDRDKAHFAFQERRSGERATKNFEIRLRSKQHTTHYFEHRSIVAILSAQGIYTIDNDTERLLLGSAGVARDITERKHAEETIAYQAFHDLLTGLPNRMLFSDRLSLAIAQARRRQEKIAVLYLDIDRFKLINDTYGHPQGDVLLKEFARRVRHCLRSGDTLARQGGDEFSVCLPEVERAEDVHGVAHKILNELRRPFALGTHDFSGTASVGIAFFPEHGDTAEALIRSADIAMNQAKRRGKNGLIEFNPDMNSTHVNRLSLENDLRQALRDGDQFELYFQPQICVGQDKVSGVEALIRWRHPQRGWVSPEDFIFLAEETGQIVAISDWVLQAGCAQLQRLHRMGYPELKLGINLSPLEFERPDLLERILAPVERHDLPRHLIDIEITENLLMRDAEAIIGKVQQLRQAGLRVSIDDFGTRYSSLNYLRRFPVSCIKIDQSFVRDLGNGSDALAIINAIAGIAQSFDLHLLAEGVETAEQMKLLGELGCQEMQGFFFSRPLPIDALEQYLASFSQAMPGH